MTHLDQNPDPPVEGSEYRAHLRVHGPGLVNRVKAFIPASTLLDILMPRRAQDERKKQK